MMARPNFCVIAVTLSGHTGRCGAATPFRQFPTQLTEIEYGTEYPGQSGVLRVVLGQSQANADCRRNTAARGIMSEIHNLTFGGGGQKASKRIVAIGLTALFSISCAQIASAESLHQALRAAYKSNPQLDAERANLRATDENVPQARSNYRPFVSFSADGSVQESDISPDTPTDGTTYPYGYSVSVNQQVFRGFTRGTR